MRWMFAAICLTNVGSINAQTADSIVHNTSVNEVQADSTINVRDKKIAQYERRRERAQRSWSKLIPTQAVVQYAGSIGLMSGGIGWHYGKRNSWETELLIGFLPKYHSETAHSTFTIKERYVPFHCSISSRWTLEPLTTGLFFNTISGSDFWRSEPSRYPKRYYGFSTKVRTHIFLGQRIKYHIPRSRRILHQTVSAYYELSTCDLYLVSKCTNKEYPLRQTLSLAFGMLWEM